MIAVSVLAVTVAMMLIAIKIVQAIVLKMKIMVL